MRWAASEACRFCVRCCNLIEKKTESFFFGYYFYYNILSSFCVGYKCTHSNFFMVWQQKKNTFFYYNNCTICASEDKERLRERGIEILYVVRAYVVYLVDFITIWTNSPSHIFGCSIVIVVINIIWKICSLWSLCRQ